MKILVLQGLPASGKSTFAKITISQNPNWVRVNRDDIRTMLSFQWNNQYEDLVKSIEADIVKTIIRQGYSVIIDDTNLNPKICDNWKEVANELSCNISFKFFHCPVAECIRRDKVRPNHSGETIIKALYNKYLKIDKNV
jgi:predicted kinase